MTPEGAPPRTDRSTWAAAYPAHRQRLLRAGFPVAAAVAFGVTLLYAVGDFATNPAFADDWLRVTVVLALPLVTWALARGPLRAHLTLVTLGFDLFYTLMMVTALRVPANTVSGTALFLSLKMVGTALLVRWDPRVQCASTAYTIALYFTVLIASGRAATEHPIHQFIGPVIGGIFSVIGAFVIDRTHRALFVRSARLRQSETELRTRLDTERALFRDLATSEARYRDLFERANDLIFVVDEAGRLHFANQAALDFLGRYAADLPQLTLAQLLPAPVHAQIERRLRIARRRTDIGRPFSIEVPRAGGEAATLEVSARLISEPGEVRTYQCIARDITERQRQETAMRLLLSEQQRANRMQTEFVANMSHEVRTPLNVIIGYTDLLLSEPDLLANDDARTFVDRIAAAARALHRLVESVLEYARLSRGQAALLPRPFPADQLLSELRALCHDLRSQPDLSVHVATAPGVELETDYERLYSALSNLLLNALKFTPQGTVELTLEPAGGEVVFTVRDTGIGIPAEQIEHVFQPFRQVDGSPTRAYGGVGLGLAIVRRNVDLLGGRLTVESRVGTGTTFRVRIPARLSRQAAAVPAGGAPTDAPQP
jgi:PAS domain S-box-containing protein